MKIKNSLLLGLACIGFAFTSHADDAASVAQYQQDADVYAHDRGLSEIHEEQLENGWMRARIPVAALGSPYDGLWLRGAFARQELSLQIAPQADIKDAKLAVRHITSIGQLSEHSHLKLGVNNHLIAQLPAALAQATSIHEVSLATDDLHIGFNRLQFDAIQRYTLECQNGSANELWTHIDAERTYLDVTYRRRTFAGRLSDLDQFIVPGIGGVDGLTIVTGDVVSSETLRWGALASQSVANRLAYKVPDVYQLSVSKLDQPEESRSEIIASDLIAVGLANELAGLLNVSADALAIDESLIEVRPSPLDPTHFLIIVSGGSPEAVDRGLLALSEKDFPFPDAGRVILTADQVAISDQQIGRMPLRADTRYRFEDLNAQDFMMSRQESGSTKVSFDLAPDVVFDPDADIEFRLDLAYGAELNRGSIVNVFLNGNFRKAIRLSNPDGEVLPDYKLQMKADLLKPGRNEIEFQVKLVAERSGACTSISRDHLVFSLDASSSFTLPEAESFVALPNLTLMADTGYPYDSSNTDGFTIVATDAEPDTLAATWMVAARLGQLRDTLYSNTSFAIGEAPTDQHFIEIGARQNLENPLPNNLLSFENSRAGRSIIQLGNSGATQQKFDGYYLGRNGLVASHETSPGSGLLRTVFTSENAQQLRRSVQTLVKPSHWSQLDGAAAVWRPNPNAFAVRSASEQFFLGNGEPSLQLKQASQQRPWRFVTIFIGLLFAIAFLLSFVARHIRKKAA